MNRYLKEKSEEIEQKEYLLKKKGQKLFWSDYYDLLALAAGMVFVWVMYRFNVNVEIFLSLSAGLVLGIGILRHRVKKWQRKKIVELICYEQGWERFKADLTGMDEERLKEKIAEILLSGGAQSDGEKICLKGASYSVEIIKNEEELAGLWQQDGGVLVITAEDKKDIRDKIKSKARGKVILGSFRDLYDLALKYNIVALPKLKEEQKREASLPQSNLLAVYGIGLLLLANVSRYFYVYFLGGIVLLSVFLAGFMKKGTISEVVFLKKAMHFSKSKV